jgi:hypothetical protein
MKNARCTRNQKIRLYLNQVCSELQSGETLQSSIVATRLSTRNRGVSTFSVGSAFRERDDMELVKTGVWVKI